MEEKYSIIAEQILRLFSGGDGSDDNTFDPREVELLVAEAHSYLVKSEYFQNIKAGESHSVNSEHLSSFIKIPVLVDTDRKESFSQLPSQYISLPGNKGINEVRQYGKPAALPLVPLKPGVNSLLSGTASGGMNGRLTYYPEADRIYFPEKAGCDLPFKFVNIRLVVPSGASVSMGQELAIMAEVTKIMAQRRPQDKVNDNNAQV